MQLMKASAGKFCNWLLVNVLQKQIKTKNLQFIAYSWSSNTEKNEIQTVVY